MQVLKKKKGAIQTRQLDAKTQKLIVRAECWLTILSADYYFGGYIVQLHLRLKSFRFFS